MLTPPMSPSSSQQKCHYLKKTSRRWVRGCIPRTHPNQVLRQIWQVRNYIDDVDGNVVDEEIEEGWGNTKKIPPRWARSKLNGDLDSPKGRSKNSKFWLRPTNPHPTPHPMSTGKKNQTWIMTTTPTCLSSHFPFDGINWYALLKEIFHKII